MLEWRITKNLIITGPALVLERSALYSLTDIQLVWVGTGAYEHDFSGKATTELCDKEIAGPLIEVDGVGRAC
jgi:hypothetical protein